MNIRPSFTRRLSAARRMAAGVTASTSGPARTAARAIARRRYLALAVSVAFGALPAITATAGPAAAQSTYHICLTYSSSWCLNGLNGKTTQNNSVVMYNLNDHPNDNGWDPVYDGTWNGTSDIQWEIASTQNTKLCLANTNNNATSRFEPCGANGTVWVQMPDPNGDGYYLADRYYLDDGLPTSITALSPFANNEGTPLYDQPAFGNEWMQWSFIPA